MSSKIYPRRLTDLSTFNTLQDELNRLNNTYLSSSFDTNVSRCIDIIQLNARVQRELFKLLNLVSAEGGVYGGASTIRTRLLPFLNVEASYLNGLLSYTSSDLYSLAWWRYPYAHLRTESEFNVLANEYEENLNELELDLRHANVNKARSATELKETRAELIDERTKSTNEKVFIETELTNLKTHLNDTEFRLSFELYKPRSVVVEEYNREIRRLHDGIELAQRRSRTRSRSPVTNYVRQRSLSPIRSLVSSTSTNSSLQTIRENKLIQRFNDFYARERLNAMDILTTVSDNYDTNQRICFSIMQKAFSITKRHFNQWKLRVRSQFAHTHVGPGLLEETVQDYINRNVDYIELPTIVTEITNNLYRNPRLSLPIGVTYSILNTYTQEAIRIAWHMSCLPCSLDLAFGNDSEIYDDTKYRRSYESDYSVSLVDHHVWPALMQESHVIIKGEASTKRNTSLNHSREPNLIRREYKSAIRSRSISPIRQFRALSSVRILPIYHYY